MGIMDIVSKVAEAVGLQSSETTSEAQTEEQGAAQNTNGGGTVRIQYYRSAISTPKKHKQIVRSLGITKLNQIVERPDTPAMRGSVKKVPHLLRIVE